jgi:hypothetical protein
MTVTVFILFIAVASLAVSWTAVRVSNRQLREARRANDFPQAVNLFREYRDPDTVAARFLVLRDLPGIDSEIGIQGLPPEARQAAEKVSHYLDNLGFLVAKDLTKPELAAGFLGGSALRVWTVLRPFIVRERELRQEPRYQEYFEHLAATIVLPEVQAKLPTVRKWRSRSEGP